MSSQTDFMIVSHMDRTGLSNSPDLNPCEYFLWGFFKEKIFPKNLQTVMELRALIIRACSEVIEDMCCKVINSIAVHAAEVAKRNGGHIKHLIHRE
jgi:hypothetical protein